jgi:hypothetical protein
MLATDRMKKIILVAITVLVLALIGIIGSRYNGSIMHSFVSVKAGVDPHSQKHPGAAFLLTGNHVHDVVYPSTLEFLQKCAKCGIMGLGDTNLAESSLENVAVEEIPGGKQTWFSLGNHKFMHLFTTNYLFKGQSGDIQILDCDRITYCGLKGAEWPWRAMTADDPKGLAEIEKRYEGHGSFEDAQKIILNLAREFNQPKNDLFDPQFVKEDVRGYDLGIVTGVYNSRNELFSGYLGIRHSYQVVPWKNGTAVLVCLMEGKASFEDKPPEPLKPANAVNGLKTVLKR